jgi:hypothetical protein
MRAYSRRDFLKGVGLVATSYTLADMLSPYSPEVKAAKSDQIVMPTPALVYSNIDGKFTDMRELQLTPLGEQLVAQDKKWMPSHEWADALPAPQTLYEYHSLTECSAYMRLKYYEKGWIDNNRWLDILIENVADLSAHFANVIAYFNPAQDYSGNSNGDYLFFLRGPGSNFALVNWGAPFTDGYWASTPTELGMGNATIGTSPDFPQVGPHLISEMRINLDSNYMYGVGDSFGFAIESASDVPYYPQSYELWPKELAQNGYNKSAHGTTLIPTYSGTCKLAVQPVDEFGNAVLTMAAGVLGSLFVVKHKRLFDITRTLL